MKNQQSEILNIEKLVTGSSTELNALSNMCSSGMHYDCYGHGA